MTNPQVKEATGLFGIQLTPVRLFSAKDTMTLLIKT